MFILFFALRSTVKRIDHNTKKFFLEKLQDYDYLIDEKQKLLTDLDTKIEEKKNELKNLTEEKIIIKEKDNGSKYYNNKVPKYSDSNIFKNYKTIKEKFPTDYRLIIEKFIKNNLTEDREDYYIAFEIKKILTNDVIYKILNLRVNEQKNKFYSLLNSEQKQFISNVYLKEKFDIKKIIMVLDDFLEKNDPKIYIYIGTEQNNLNINSDKIKVIIDSNINEGIKISYKGNLYDYSL